MIPKDCKRLAEVDFTIAEAFHRTGAVEVWGRGTNRVIAACEKHGAAPPVF
jgi:predicted HTH transcriptional regulator